MRRGAIETLPAPAGADGCTACKALARPPRRRLVEGDDLAVRYHIDATHGGEFNGIPATGKRVSFSGTTIMCFKDGKVVERWSESDFLGLLQQVGAIPPLVAA